MAISIKGAYVHGYSKINNFIGYFRKVVLLTDPVFSLKIVAFLYLGMRFASVFGDIGTVWVFLNWVCWSDKLNSLVCNFYGAVAK
mmetsp:Transcript_2905/g.418  ORF Transcript_2905/g.418 Transcript_2905/m.418 type:complete len:85 (+) Transcript_2905:308-562(+)